MGIPPLGIELTGVTPVPLQTSGLRTSRSTSLSIYWLTTPPCFRHKSAMAKSGLWPR